MGVCGCVLLCMVMHVMYGLRDKDMVMVVVHRGYAKHLRQGRENTKVNSLTYSVGFGGELTEAHELKRNMKHVRAKHSLPKLTGQKKFELFIYH